MMPSPTYSFCIPSIHDDTQLDCRVYHPQRVSRKGAVFAHPYAPLGGSFDDEVVLTVVRLLLSHGYVVGTFNFRGAGSSKGRTSWTSKPEIADYISFVGFFVTYLTHIRFLDSPSVAPTASGPESPGIDPDLNLLLGGYSYGALLTIQLPFLDTILGRFEHAALGSAEAEIRLRAEGISRQRRQFLTRERKYSASLSPGSPGLVCGGEESEPGTRRMSRDAKISIDGLRRSMDRSRRKISGKHASDDHLPRSPSVELRREELKITRLQFLLVSPLLPPLAWFIAISTPSLASLAGQTHASGAGEDDKLCRNDSFSIYGSKDNFTSVKRLRKWSERLHEVDQSRFQAQEISGADHFWMAHSAGDKLKQSIGDWLGNKSSGNGAAQTDGR